MSKQKIAIQALVEALIEAGMLVVREDGIHASDDVTACVVKVGKKHGICRS